MPLAVVRVLRVLVTSVDAASGSSTPGRIAGHSAGHIAGHLAGHLGMGVVESTDAAGDLAARWLAKRVTWNSITACARCERCRAGLSAHCESRLVLGFAGRAGCLAERVTIPVRDLIEVPAKVDDDRAAYAGLVGAVLQIGHAVRLDGKTFVTVLGDGPVGLLTAQVMAGRNASVRLLGRHEARFSIAERWGVKHRHESEVGRRHDQDIVIDCTGSPSGLALASRLVRPRGTIVVKGPPHTDALPNERIWPADLAPLLAAEVTLRHVSTMNTREGLDAVASGAVDVLTLAARRFRLSNPAAALAAARDQSIAAVLAES